MSKEEMIIDPPVGLGMRPSDILPWIDELEKMPQSGAADFELERARRLLITAENKQNTGIGRSN